MSARVRFSLPFVVVVFLLVLLAACGGAAAEPPSATAAPDDSATVPAVPTAPADEAPPEEAPADTPAPAAELPTEPPAAAPTEAPADAPANAPTARPTEALPADAPADARPLEVVGYGFGVGDFGAGWGLVVRNPNPAYALEDSRYTLTALDAAGNALYTEEGALPLLRPEQRLGVGGALQVDDEAAVAALEVVVVSGEFVAREAGALITAADIVYTPGNFSDEVTATLVNPYAVELADLRVTAVAFDAADHIIGGGVTVLDLLPAGGNAPVTVPITVGGEPARVEVFAVVDGLAAIGE